MCSWALGKVYKIDDAAKGQYDVCYKVTITGEVKGDTVQVQEAKMLPRSLRDQLFRSGREDCFASSRHLPDFISSDRLVFRSRHLAAMRLEHAIRTLLPKEDWYRCLIPNNLKVGRADARCYARPMGAAWLIRI